MGLVQTKINGLWVAKQTARGSVASTAIKRLRQPAGNIRTNRSDGTERWGTDDRFGDAQDYVDSLIGDGDPGAQATPGVLAYLLYLFAGQETVTGAADPYTHVITPAAAGGFWSTWWKKVGVGSELVRERFADVKIGQLVIEGSTAQKIVRITPTLISLDPGEKVAADPVKALDTGNDGEAFLYTEGESAFSINGSVIRAQSQFQITLNENMEPVYTDSVLPLDAVAGEPEATLALTLALDADGLARYNFEIYGSTSPAAGTKPLKKLPALGDYSFLLDKAVDATPGNNRQFGFDVDAVRWSPDVAVAPNPSGGLSEVSLTGRVRRTAAGTEAWKATVKNMDAAYV